MTLTAPLSFWGGVDILTADIIDRSHPQHGQNIKGMCLSPQMIPRSGATPSSVAAMIRAEVAPAAIILGMMETNAITGLLVGQRLYGRTCTLFVATEKRRTRRASALRIRISSDGTARVA
ncbi:MAG: DUF126 domain-containing protein [Pseudomonadota bacterium]